MKILFFCLAFILLFGYSQSLNAQASIDLENPAKVSVCDLILKRREFDRKLVELTTFVTHGFENFSVFDPECKVDFQDIWLEYGGTLNSGTVYCCGTGTEKKRKRSLTVEGITLGLITDRNLGKFNQLIESQPSTTVRATLVGRFFAGSEMKVPSGSIWGGYGHMGCCSLLVIQQILSVEPHDRDDLNYGTGEIPVDMGRFGSYRILNIDEPAIELQQSAEQDNVDWRFKDPRRVAKDALAKYAPDDEVDLKKLNVVSQKSGYIAFEAKIDRYVSYFVRVERPYWLSFYAKDPKRVIWIASGVYRAKK